MAAISEVGPLHGSHGVSQCLEQTRCEPQAERAAEESAAALAVQDADVGAALDGAAASIAGMESAVAQANRCSLLLCKATIAMSLQIVRLWQPSHSHCRFCLMGAGFHLWRNLPGYATILIFVLQKHVR